MLPYLDSTYISMPLTFCDISTYYFFKWKYQDHLLLHMSVEKKKEDSYELFIFYVANWDKIYMRNEYILSVQFNEFWNMQTSNQDIEHFITSENLCSFPFSLSSPEETITLIFSLAVLEFHMNKITQCVFFCALFLLLNLMFPIYICVIVNISSLFLFIQLNIP